MTPTQIDAAALPTLPVAAWMTIKTKDGKKTLEHGVCSTNPQYPAVHKEWVWEPLIKLSDALSAIAAQPQAVAVPGWQLVPVAPTPMMLVALWGHRDAMRGESENQIARTGYATMLAAAPQPPAQQPEKVDLAACEEGGVTQWQPISTAPMYTPVRLYAQGGGFHDEDFNSSGSVEGFLSDDGNWCGAFWNPEQDCWDRRDGIAPTNWMPLPSPPARGNESPTSEINPDSPSANKEGNHG